MTLSNYKTESAAVQKHTAAVKLTKELAKETFQENRHLSQAPLSKQNQTQDKKFISWLLPF